jgi:hypothetical protein
MMMRGGGGVGRFVRTVQAGSRVAARQDNAKQLQPYQLQQQKLEAQIMTVDRAIIQVEAYIVRNQ